MAHTHTVLFTQDSLSDVTCSHTHTHTHRSSTHLLSSATWQCFPPP